MANGLYVYAIVPAHGRIPDGITGIGDASLTLVRCGELAAVVGEIEREPVRASAANLLGHEAVVEALSRALPLLPVRFGTVLPGVDSIRRRLDEQYALLEADLARLGESCEFGLLVRWPPEEVIVAAGNRVERPAPVPDDASDGRRYMQARLAEHRRERALRARAEQLADVIDAALAGSAIDRRRTLAPTAQLAVRSTFLVKRGRVDAFRAAFAELRRAQPEHVFLLSGPWPPYSFVTQPGGDAEATLRSWLREFGLSAR